MKKLIAPRSYDIVTIGAFTLTVQGAEGAIYDA